MNATKGNACIVDQMKRFTLIMSFLFQKEEATLQVIFRCYARSVIFPKVQGFEIHSGFNPDLADTSKKTDIGLPNAAIVIDSMDEVSSSVHLHLSQN